MQTAMTSGLHSLSLTEDPVFKLSNVYKVAGLLSVKWLGQIT